MDIDNILGTLFPHKEILSGLFGTKGQGGFLNNALGTVPQTVQAVNAEGMVHDVTRSVPQILNTVAPGGIPAVVQSIAPGGIPGVVQSLPMPQSMRPSPAYSDPYGLYDPANPYGYNYDPRQDPYAQQQYGAQYGQQQGYFDPNSGWIY